MMGFFMLKRALLALIFILFTFEVMASGSVTLNGKVIKNREQLHDSFAKQLNFSKHYARNSDSLYEVLSSDYSGESIIKIKSVNLLRAKLGNDYIDSMIQSIMDASEENTRIILVLE